jgi:hypothetical protein
MKIREIVKEGFWDRAAALMGGHFFDNQDAARQIAAQRNRGKTAGDVSQFKRDFQKSVKDLSSSKPWEAADKAYALANLLKEPKYKNLPNYVPSYFDAWGEIENHKSIDPRVKQAILSHLTGVSAPNVPWPQTKQPAQPSSTQPSPPAQPSSTQPSPPAQPLGVNPTNKVTESRKVSKNK